MNEQELGKEIAKLLNHSINENMKQSTVYRLQSARRTALEHCQPTLKIMSSGNGTSVYGGHDGYFNIGKLLLLLTVLFAFVLVSTTYWQFLEKGKYTTVNDTELLADDVPTDTYMDNEFELVDDVPTDTYMDNEFELIDDVPSDTHVDNVFELVDDLPTDTLVDNELELELADDLPTDTLVDNELELADDLPTDTGIDHKFDKWLDSN
ncbi:MAG: DUF3619 family protein [Nitrosomonas sp.]|nr:DUF3619 family protein [Nitrosomonas sp.]